MCPAWENQDKTRYDSFLSVIFQNAKDAAKVSKIKQIKTTQQTSDQHWGGSGPAVLWYDMCFIEDISEK